MNAITKDPLKSVKKVGFFCEKMNLLQLLILPKLRNQKFCHSLCKQCVHDLQFMKKGFSSPNLSKLARADISCQFIKTRSLCRTVYKITFTVFPKIMSGDISKTKLAVSKVQEFE